MKKSLSRNEHKNKNKQADRVSYSVTSPNRAPTSVGLLLIDKNNLSKHCTRLSQVHEFTFVLTRIRHSDSKTDGYL